MDVSIIIVNYNTISLLIDAIDSVLEKTKDVVYEIIVVDNNSNDNSQFIIGQKYNTQVKYMALTENIGFGRANNKGFEIAKGRNVFLLNPDTILQNNAVKILSDFLDDNSLTGVAGANLYNDDGTYQPSFSQMYPSLKVELSNLFHLMFLQNKQCINETDEAIQTQSVVGAAMMIKKEVIEKVGVFNPKFFIYGEEEELCNRIRKVGFLIFNVPSAKITHLDGKSFQFSENRQKRRLDGIRTLYSVSYNSFYCTILKVVEYTTIVSRLIIFKMLKKDEKIQYWSFMYKNRKWYS
ncbi:glycosyltransferase family 2 protein [Solitalea lacus]|uniref:glycosyltransferase family 2 protein n=1 Tax=Solitalea lacus TaxID=2911172 RepID=UPI001ED9E59B|nr:glycosyltransferase family 2 protein [Solitalea lacus]UKJ08250.1 glycosyltransferase family 2 protein [Solitalea lacus]